MVTERRAYRNRDGEVFAAASKIFGSKGYSATSVQEIADAVGIQKGTIYYYISSKEHLLYSLIKHGHEVFVESVSQIRDLDCDALSLLAFFVTEHTRTVAANSDICSLMLSEFRHMTPEHQHDIIQRRRTYEETLQELIVKAQMHSLACPDLDSHLTAHQILGLLNSCFRGADGPTKKEIDRMVEANVRFVLAALTCTPSEQAPAHRHAVRAFVSAAV